MTEYQRQLAKKLTKQILDKGDTILTESEIYKTVCSHVVKFDYKKER